MGHSVGYGPHNFHVSNTRCEKRWRQCNVVFEPMHPLAFVDFTSEYFFIPSLVLSVKYPIRWRLSANDISLALFYLSWLIIRTLIH
jgi:hypothetical protein